LPRLFFKVVLGPMGIGIDLNSFERSKRAARAAGPLPGLGICAGVSGRVGADGANLGTAEGAEKPRGLQARRAPAPDLPIVGFRASGQWSSDASAAAPAGVEQQGEVACLAVESRAPSGRPRRVGESC